MMKRGLAAFLTGIMTVTLMAAGLTGCGSNTADKETEKVRLMVWSPSEDQSKDSGEWLQQCAIILQKSTRSGTLHLSME